MLSVCDKKPHNLSNREIKRLIQDKDKRAEYVRTHKRFFMRGGGGADRSSIAR